MTTLSNGQYVRLATWTHSVASVGTLDGMALKPETLAMCRNRRDPECWTVYAGSTISDSKAFYERDRARVAGATVIADGETVEIEGKQYRVRVIPGNAGSSPRNSDPIQFVPCV
jgi:hypothetical protein